MMPSVESSISHEVLLTFSQFALAPRGNGGSSFRITEAVKAGAIPIYIWGGNDQAMPALPFRHRIDWSLAAIVLEDHEQVLTHLIIDCYSREILSQMRSYLKSISYFFSVPGFINAMMQDIHAVSIGAGNYSHPPSGLRRNEHPRHPSAWIIGASVGLARWKACISDEEFCSISSLNAVLAAMYLIFFKMFQADHSQVLRLNFFNHYVQSSNCSCLLNLHLFQVSPIRSLIDCPFLFLNPNITHSDAKKLFCKEAAHFIFTAFGSVHDVIEDLSLSNRVRALRIFRSCKKDSSRASDIYFDLMHKLQTACNVSSVMSTCSNLSSRIVNSESMTSKFLDIFSQAAYFSFVHREQKASHCRTVHIYSSTPSAFHNKRIFSSLLGALQFEKLVQVVHPKLQLPSTTSFCSNVNFDSAVPCILIAFDSSTLHLYDIFQPHFWRPAYLNIHVQDSMFYSSRHLWVSLNSSCSVIDVVDATTVPKQNIIGIYHALVSALSLNDTVMAIFTDELPVHNWDLPPLSEFGDNYAQLLSDALSPQFKQSISSFNEPQLSSYLKDAQSALATYVGSWPPCIIAYLPSEPCVNTSCLQSLATLAKHCSNICDDKSIIIIGDAASPLSDSTLAVLQEYLQTSVPRMFYVDNDDVFEESEDASLIHMLSHSSCALVSVNSSSIGTQAVLTRSSIQIFSPTPSQL
jgi:hypothetical protein